MLILYGVGAYAAAGAQYLAGPNDMMPMIGASGAISAVLGAYAMLFGRNRVKIANPKLALYVNAAWLAGGVDRAATAGRDDVRNRRRADRDRRAYRRLPDRPAARQAAAAAPLPQGLRLSAVRKGDIPAFAGMTFRRAWRR